MNDQSYSTYMLLDTAQMPQLENRPWIKDRRCRGWMERLYERRASGVSPVLIDIEAALRTQRVAELMEFTNACDPKYHVSFIDTQLSLTELAEHLKRLIYFVSESGDEFTLRFADGAVLPALASVLTPEQWKSIHAPVIRWRVHRADNTLQTLQVPLALDCAELPLQLSAEQMTALKEAMAAHQLLANVKNLRPGRLLAPNPAEEHRLVGTALTMWRASGQRDSEALAIFLLGVFDTGGRVLLLPAMPKILSEHEPAQLRAGIAKAIAVQLSVQQYEGR